VNKLIITGNSDATLRYAAEVNAALLTFLDDSLDEALDEHLDDVACRE